MLKTSIGRIVAVCATVGITSLSVNLSANAAGATKVQLLANSGGDCTIGASFGTKIPGFALIHSNGRGTLIAVLSLKGATPNHTYDVGLVQTPSGEGCLSGEFQITTNGQGNATINMQEPLLAGTTGAFVLTLFSDNLGNIASFPTVAIPQQALRPNVAMKSRIFGPR